MKSLTGKVALITGAGRGIGRAICTALAQAGAVVAINYAHSEKQARDLQAQIAAEGGRACLYRADVSKEDQVQAMVEAIVQEFGRLDILVNSAGIICRTPFLEISLAEWNRVLGVNLTGAFLCGQAAARRMVAEGGAIINIGSNAGLRPSRLRSHYCVSKAGLAMLTEAMALELAPFHIRVNAIAPGTIQTDMNREALSDPTMRAARLQTVPLGRLGVPEDLQGTVLYLASEAASYVTGCTILLDGGQFLV